MPSVRSKGTAAQRRDLSEGTPIEQNFEDPDRAD